MALIFHDLLHVLPEAIFNYGTNDIFTGEFNWFLKGGVMCVCDEEALTGLQNTHVCDCHMCHTPQPWGIMQEAAILVTCSDLLWGGGVNRSYIPFTLTRKYVAVAIYFQM